jgi:alkanesulfonate monooxygenase SsuD/methylene tetrahydromethanopterin reductase-like flavin-dependent oxidoreductase (luciferase family)
MADSDRLTANTPAAGWKVNDSLRRTKRGMTFGVLLPHFGREASRERILEGSQLVERLGFDAVWVRDHLLWTPHGHESSDLTFLDASVTLAAVAAVTEKVMLGTAVLIPIRWPLKSAKELMTLDFLAGPGRIVAGLGAGHEAAELMAAGLDPDKKNIIVEETIQIWRQAFESDAIDFTGEAFETGRVQMHPRPANGLPIWYGGTTRAAVRRAAKLCDGWLPGGTPIATFDDRLSYLRELEAEAGRAPCVVGVIPKLQIGASKEKALDGLSIEALAGASEGSKWWIKPPGGFTTFDDLRGILVAGNAEQIIEGVGDYDERGLDHYVVDLRGQFDRFEELLTLFAEDVMPHFRQP